MGGGAGGEEVVVGVVSRMWDRREGGADSSSPSSLANSCSDSRLDHLLPSKQDAMVEASWGSRTAGSAPGGALTTSRKCVMNETFLELEITSAGSVSSLLLASGRRRQQDLAPEELKVMPMKNVLEETF